jgi:diguanylate cyclase (GGDEF)-like protein/PAS domain S-box-containing protein
VSAAPPFEPGLTKAELAQAWAEVLCKTTDPPMPEEQAGQLLPTLINRLATAAARVPVDEQAVIGVAAELVGCGLTGSGSLGHSIAVLHDGLPRLPDLQDVDRPEAAVLRVLSALASEYAETLRQLTVDEHERVTQALLHAKQDAERELQICEGRFRAIFFTAAVGIAISTFDGTVVAANPAFAEIVGRRTVDLIGAALPEVLQAKNDPQLTEAYRMLTDGELARFRHRRQVTATTDELAWTHLGASLLHDADGVPTHHVTVVENDSELHLLRQELSTQALHDVLTGLPNEQYLMSRLQAVLENADPSAVVTLYRVNLDNFSVINDGIGRATGEKLLRTVANRLTDLVSGQPAMVARMGADDFAILIENGPDNPGARALAASINETLSEPAYLDDHGIAISAGVGVVRRPARGISPAELIRAADATLHSAKRIGPGQWDLYDAQADTLARKRYQLAAEMPEAWENGEIKRVFKPIYGLDSGWIVALQTVPHWDRADGTAVGNSECLALAEQTGLVISLGRWLLQEACLAQTQVLRCPTSGNPRMRVDLTARLSQDPDLVALVNGALSNFNLAADQLRIGVPLAALARDRGDVVDNVGVLAELGVEMVLLGAAAGPGHLAYLEDLPVGAVEIAPDIVARIAQRGGDDSIVAQSVRQTIPLVHSAGATVIVPGVDTPEQAQWWRNVGADSAQGEHFSPLVRDTRLPEVLTRAFLSRS